MDTAGLSLYIVDGYARLPGCISFYICMFISVHLIGTCSSSSPVGVQAKMPQGRLNYNRNINVQSIQKAFVSFKKISTKI